MADVDPDTLLEWLSMGQGDERDMQLIALEQLCMLLLMSDNVDRCFESCPPRTFLPALCRIFLDECAPENVLEVTARAITYYLDVSAECTRRIVAVEGAIKALCNRLVLVDLSSRTSKDLGEQCVKVLEFVCTREAGAVFEAGGLQCGLTFIQEFGNSVHKDTLHSAMNVVSRLCGRMEPQDQNLETCVKSLSTLLKHEDPFVADGALRCFALLADRFTRRGVDPAPLAEHGLTKELLERLAKAAVTGADKPGGSGATPDSKSSSTSVSTIVSLLSTLCRGSPGITHDLLRSELPDAMEKALQGDERCTLDTMRLVDLLLVLLFEGRRALPKACASISRASMGGLRRFDSSSERSHRQLIDCIRSKDTDALIDAIENGGFEVNFMDDVGQTLLNWASAFGTLEMVEYLCERGADVNRGQRSSSLHYAACFGRPAVAKTLLRHGANPDLRDEDGKTPMDKARERNDEGHREVVHILQSPGEWMVPVSSSASSGSSSASSSASTSAASSAPSSSPSTPQPILSPEEEKKEEAEEQKGDPEMAPVYLRRLLPVFAKSYLSTMVPSIKKASLALMRKMIHYSTQPLIQELAQVTSIASPIVEVIAVVLDLEEDDDGHLMALQIVQDLLEKSSDTFLDHFARLGVISHVAELAGPPVAKQVEDQHASQQQEKQNQQQNSKHSENTKQSEQEQQQDQGGAEEGAQSDTQEHAESQQSHEESTDHIQSDTHHDQEPGQEGEEQLQIGGEIQTGNLSQEQGDQGENIDNAADQEDGHEGREKSDKTDDVKTEEVVQEDASELEQGKPYHWHDWCVVRSRDCLYLWNESCALELSNGSNGWFRFILDGKLATMYSSGSPEGGSDSSESRGEFLEKLQRARGQVKLGVASRPILSSPGPTKMVIGNWSVSCVKEKEVIIHNSDGQQATILREDLAGFIFESNRGTKHTFTAETSLGPEFAAGWTGKRGKRFISKLEAQKQKIRALAAEIQDKYFVAAQQTPREVVSKLQRIVAELNESCLLQESQEEGEEVWRSKAYEALKSLLQVLIDDNTVSSFELQTSGLVTALLNFLNQPSILGNSDDDNIQNVATERVASRIAVFKSAFGETEKEINEESVDAMTPAVILVRKLVAVLESMEKLPVYTYDSPGTGLQVLTRRLRFRLERAPGETALIDRSGRSLKMEPLTTVGSLEKHLLKMVAKQWYDYDRTTFNFIRRLKAGHKFTFTHARDFDENGLMFWIGTNGRSVSEWVNPASVGLVVVTSSEGKNLPYGKPEDILSRDSAALNCHTNDDKNAWFAIDLGVWVVPSCYSLRHARGYGRSALRNWLFQVSKDGKNWTTLYTHTDDSSLNEPGSTASWPLEPPQDSQGWRHVRLLQNGKNASGQTHYLSLSGLEIYGVVLEAVEDPIVPDHGVSKITPSDSQGNQSRSSLKPCWSLCPGKAAREVEAALRRQRRLIRTQMLKHLTVGNKVVRGMDWKFKDPEGLGEVLVAGDIQNVTRHDNDLPAGWVEVSWNNASSNSCRLGSEGKYDLKVVEMRNPGPSMSVSSNQEDIPLSTPSHDDPSQEPDPVPGEESPRAEQESPNNEDSSGAAPGGSAQHEDFKSDIPFSVPVQEATGVPLARIPSGTESQGTLERDSSTENIQPEQLVEEDSTEGKPPEHVGGETAVEGTNDPTKVSQSAQPGKDTALPQQSIEDAEGQQVEGEGHGSHDSSEETPADHQGKKGVHQASTDKSISRTETSTFVVNVRGSVSMIPACSTSSTPTSSLSRASDIEAEVYEAVRGSGLLADLEDEDDLPEPDDDEDEDEDDDDENEEDNEDDYDEVEEEMEQRGCRRRTWDDEFVLKRQFSALVPAFDPRPGRTNVQQTQDIEIPPPGSPEKVTSADLGTLPEARLALSIKCPALPELPETEITLDDCKATIFSYVQQAALATGGSKNERMRRVWEPTYTIVYNEMRNGDATQRSVYNETCLNDATHRKSKEESEIPVRWTSSYVEHHLGAEELPKSEVITFLQHNADPAFLRKWKLTGAPRSIRKNRNCSQLVAAYKEFYDNLGTSSAVGDQEGTRTGTEHNLPLNLCIKSDLEPIEDILQLLRLLYSISASSAEKFGADETEKYGFIVDIEEFTSKKLTTKVTQQMMDPLVLAGGALPSWCERLTKTCPMLFPFETRKAYFSCTAFGCSRAIVWLQNKRDAVLERSRPPSMRREEQHEFRIGRLKHERVRVPRGNALLDWAMNMLKFHADRKSVLEVEFEDEEGTGLGPSLEFYALVAAELQRKILGMWLCDDDVQDELEREVDIGHGVRPPGYYVQRSSGLFPAPLPQDHPDTDRVVSLFHVLGIFIAKSLQDNRLVDIPLSLSFLKLLCSGGTVKKPATPPPQGDQETIDSIHEYACSSLKRVSECSDTTNERDFDPEVHSVEENENTINKLDSKYSKESELIEEELVKEEDSELDKEKDDDSVLDSRVHESLCWFAGLLDDTDFSFVDPHRAKFLKQLKELVQRKKDILCDNSLSSTEKESKVAELKFRTDSGLECALEDLGLTFQFSPSSKVFGFKVVDLKPHGEDLVLTLDNAEEYIELVVKFCLYTGIRRQMDAFKDGFNQVFMMEKLALFSPEELQLMLCGEQIPQWSREDILSYTEPKYGYTRESAGFHRFVNVLASMTGDERKAFLQFTTGCSSLPPGGLANLHPRLTVVRKEGEGDGTYPSVNTCVHYLKLPEYSSEEVLREKLLAATIEKGFHLN